MKDSGQNCLLCLQLLNVMCVPHHVFILEPSQCGEPINKKCPCTWDTYTYRKALFGRMSTFQKDAKMGGIVNYPVKCAQELSTKYLPDSVFHTLSLEVWGMCLLKLGLHKILPSSLLFSFPPCACIQALDGRGMLSNLAAETGRGKGGGWRQAVVITACHRLVFPFPISQVLWFFKLSAQIVFGGVWLIMSGFGFIKGAYKRYTIRL